MRVCVSYGWTARMLPPALKRRHKRSFHTDGQAGPSTYRLFYDRTARARDTGKSHAGSRKNATVRRKPSSNETAGV